MASRLIWSAFVKGRLSAKTQASCAQVQRSFDALCDEFDAVYASASAEGPVLDLLDEDYDVLPIEDTVPRSALGHVVIGPSDLAGPEVIDLLTDAYDNGKIVAIANAGREDADEIASRAVHATLATAMEFVVDRAVRAATSDPQASRA